MKRMRGRNHRSGGGGGGFRNQQNGIPLNRNHVFESSGPEMRVRGTAQQLYDKYMQLARDAASSADRVLSEAHYQHAEHYFRVLSAINAAQGLPPPGQNSANGEARYSNGQTQSEYQPRAEQAPETSEAPAVREPRQERQDSQDFREPRDNNRHERRFEPRQRQEFQPRERQQDHGYRPASEVASTPIDISSALEAELRATIREEPKGMGVQPEIRPHSAPPRAIPIVPDAPPAPTPELTLTPAAPRRRGRPPRVRPVEAE